MQQVERLDFGRFSRVERTPQGGMRVPAHLTRTGVFVYTRADGTKIRELRHPDEVFSEDSLSTLSGAPITNRHPDRAVSPRNWRSLSVGHVGENVGREDKFVAARLMIQDADTISDVERQDADPEALRELSCGYSCWLDETPGEFDGERYDAIQRTIRYNHVALGPAGWGRAGREVALRLDSNGNSINPASDSEPPKENIMKVIRIDGVEYEVGSDAHISKLESMHKAALATVTQRADTAEGERDAAVKARDELQGKLDAATDPKALDALVAARVELVTDARKLLGAEAKLDGKTDREIMIEAVRKEDSNFDAEGKSDDYVRAFFDARTRSVKRHDEGGTGIAAVRSAAVSSRRDGGGKEVDRNDADAARQRMLDHNRDAATKPLRFSRSS